MAKSTPQCVVCGKATKAECSHIDCANRRRITAQVRHEPAARTVDGDPDWSDARVIAQGSAHA
jgi:hypothetical protein